VKNPTATWLPIARAVNQTCRQLGVAKVHQRTAIRWAQKGKQVNGRLIKLKSRRFNGRLQTTTELVRRFLDEANNASRSDAERRQDRRTEQRRRELDLVTDELTLILSVRGSNLSVRPGNTLATISEGAQ